MEKFTILDAVAVPFDQVDIDTNQLCPTRFNKVEKGPKYAEVLFHDLRFNADGSEKPEFILNQPPHREAGIIVADRNFGCGSSREHAPWGLQDYGFQAVVAPSFADIFYSNCTKIGLLPVVLSEEDCHAFAHAGEGSIDLEAQEVRFAEREVAFEIDHEIRRRLLHGLDDIGATLTEEDAIVSYERDRERSGPVTLAL